MFTWPAVSTTSNMYSWLLCFSSVVNAEKKDKAEVTTLTRSDFNVKSRLGPRFHFRIFFVKRIQQNHSLFSIVGSYESTNCPSTNWIVIEDFPEKKNTKKIKISWKSRIVTEQKLPARSFLQVASTIQKLPTERNPITTIFLDFAGAIVNWKLELSLT